MSLSAKTTKTDMTDDAKVQEMVQSLKHIESANTPLVQPSEAKGGTKPTELELALEKATITGWAAKALAAGNETRQAQAVHKAAVAASVAEYYAAMEAIKDDATAGQYAEEVKEQATAKVSRALADAILANVYDRKEARRIMGESFGFKISEATKKPMSQPLEPGNTIAKRVASVTIAVEYAHSGQLPDKGGDSLPNVGQGKLEELLADYFDGQITVRQASEKIEAAIRETRETIPMEMDADRVLALAGKIQTASEAIAKNIALRDSYTALLIAIKDIPFPD